ncbi:MAG: pknD [Bacilli bacterium]|nr:pknD [Bacilli bacterium]
MMKTLKSRWVLLFLAVWVVVAGIKAFPVHAEVPYTTFTQDSYGFNMPSETAYEPVNVIGKDLHINGTYSPLNQPQGVYIDSNDQIYVADTNNNRVVQFDPDGNFVRAITLPDSPLKAPQGVFVNDNGDIYIADTGNKRIVVLNADGTLKHQPIMEPKSVFIPDTFKFDPIKVVVDKRGFMYIATLGGYEGLLELAPDGAFQSFYGTNKTDYSIFDTLKRIFYTKQQLALELSKLPGSVNNVAIDKYGFIYTTTIGLQKEEIKKINLAGQNVFKDKTFGIPPFTQSGNVVNSQFVALTVDHNGNVTAVDKLTGRIWQYDPSGSLLFYWGSGGLRGQQNNNPSAPNVGTDIIGLSRTPTGIASDSKNNLYVLDAASNTLQEFRLTEFANLVQTASSLTQTGHYAESEPYWQKILFFNTYFFPAYEGLAKASYQKGDYHEAMADYRLAGDQQGYSDSYWKIRLSWFQKYFGFAASTVVILLIIGNIWTALAKKFGWRRSKNSKVWFDYSFINHLRHTIYVLKHPLDGFASIRYEKKGSLWSAWFLLILVAISLGINNVYTSFTFNNTPIYAINVSNIVIGFVAGWVSWIVSNYLINSIYRGEGRFRDVIIGSSYALSPVILIGLPLTLISNILTTNEASIFHFFNTVMLCWCALLFFWQIQAQQNYSFGETVVNVLLSLFTLLVLWVLIAIIFGLSSQVTDFVYGIYQEVSIR